METPKPHTTDDADALGRPATAGYAAAEREGGEKTWTEQLIEDAAWRDMGGGYHQYMTRRYRSVLGDVHELPDDEEPYRLERFRFEARVVNAPKVVGFASDLLTAKAAVEHAFTVPQAA